MKWRSLYLKAAYALMLVSSVISVAGFDTKWH